MYGGPVTNVSEGERGGGERVREGGRGGGIVHVYTCIYNVIICTCNDVVNWEREERDCDGGGRRELAY